MSKRKHSSKLSPLTRRGFLKAAGAAGVVYWLGPKLMIGGKAYAAIPGGTLDLGLLLKFATPLLIPPAMPRAGTIGNIDYYEIAVQQFQQQILPAGQPKTTVWGYGSKVGGARAIFNAPSLTIEARQGRPVRIKWINELVDANNGFLPHLLPVDPTLHWANPPGGTAGRDTRPTFTATPGSYTGPVPMVTHVHGAVGVGDESDGYAEAWYLPAANNIPAGYARVGNWYDDFKAKAQQKFGVTWERGSAVFQYPNANRASTIWYHDHTLGMTRLNVYAGPAGFYIVRGGTADLPAGVLPGPAPQRGDPAGTKYYEIPIAIQDRSFNADGSLFYPDSRSFFPDGPGTGITGPYIPDSDISPIWNPEFFGNMIMVNGNTWPYLQVERRRYRFRFLNGCQARFLILDFSKIIGVEVWQIGNEGGFLAAPVNMTSVNGNQILMCPAERADVIVDFTGVVEGSYILGNVGPDAPFAGLPVDPAEVADPATTGQVMQFRVVPIVGVDNTTPPQSLQLPAIAPLPDATVTRPVALLEELSMTLDNQGQLLFPDAPAELLLGTVTVDPNTGTGTCHPYMWSDEVTENVNLGATEVWEFYNATVDAHPMHVHEVAFEVVDRQAITVDEATKTVQVVPGSTPQDPEPWETGFKDTVIAYPEQVTRVKATFATPGQFVWHCHIVEHEDNEMMRPYAIDDTAGFPRTPVLDNFDRANGRLGPNWRGDVDSYQILSNQAKPLRTGAIFWNPTSFGPSQEAYFTFTGVSTTAKEQDLILKLTGGNPNAATAQMIEVWLDVRNAVVKVFTRDQVNGWVRRATFTGVSFAAGDQLGARALADGKVIVFKRASGATTAVPIGSTYVTRGAKPWPANLVKGGGKIGVWFIQNNAGAPLAASFDDFGGGNI